MVEVISREKDFRDKHIPRQLRKLGLSIGAKNLYNAINKDALRAWRSLSYSGAGVISTTVFYLLKKQYNAGISLNLNAIPTDSFSNFKYYSRIILARATAIRTHVIGQHLQDHGYEKEFDEEHYNDETDHEYDCRYNMCREAEENEFFELELSGLALASAVEYNKKKAKSVGWYNCFDEIVASVLKLNHSPNEETFAQEVADWQSKNNLNDDGKIGPSTWNKMKRVLGLSSGSSSSNSPYPVVNAFMPKEGTGFYCRMNKSRRWALPETIKALTQIGNRWSSKHPFGPRIIISDISKQGGGPLCFNNGRCHTSHQVGLDVDIRPIRKDMNDSSRKLCYKDSSYSSELTRELIDIIRNNGVLKVKNIAFLDPSIPNLSRWKRHGCHLHVRFCMPPKYKHLINFQKTYSSVPPSYRC